MACMKKRTFLELGIKATAGVAVAGIRILPASAQGKFPDRPIRLVAPFAPGGDVDIIARLWAKYAAPHLGGGTIVVENKPGAGGAIGAAEVARARGDGYTLLLGSTTTQIINPRASTNPQYDALKDFALISMPARAACSKR